MKRVLGIETSCDETGIAVVDDGIRIVENIVASQVNMHAPFGGVVPEIASRQHASVIDYLTRQVLEKVGGEIHAVATTVGPGLMGSLLVGVNFGKALAYAWKIPFIPIHHIEGHIFAAFLIDEATTISRPEFPFLSLVVSGGHTMLIYCFKPHEYKILGTTRDDAVGECFDKVSRLLGLGYPGGPAIQKAAENGNPHAFQFPKSMCSSDNLEFSYSGLKTAVLYTLRDLNVPVLSQELIADLAASFQNTAIDILVAKTKQALEVTGAKQLIVAGGVAANRLLRERLTREIDAEVFLPPLSLCLDNGAMIAAAGYSRWLSGKVGTISTSADPNFSLI